VGCRAGLNVMINSKSVASVWSRVSLVQLHSQKYGPLSVPRLYSSVLVRHPGSHVTTHAMVML
jgi:hypothetical protein